MADNTISGGAYELKSYNCYVCCQKIGDVEPMMIDFLVDQDTQVLNVYYVHLNGRCDKEYLEALEKVKKALAKHAILHWSILGTG